MKRICVYGCSETFGGTERYLMTMYQAIDRTEIQFDFLFPHDIGDISYRNQIEALGGKIYCEYYKYSEKKDADFISPEKLISKHPEWDGVYVNWQSVDTAYRLIIAAKKMKLQYRVIHAHSSDYNRPFGLKDKIYERFFYLSKDKYVTDYLACSEQAGKWLFKMEKENFTVIPNAVPFEKFAFSKEKRDAIRMKYQISDQEIVLGFCGRLVAQKNPEYLLHIFEDVHKKEPRTKLLMVGDGVMRKEIENQIRALHLQKSVIMTGAVSNVENYMQAMDCFLVPSRFEGFGIVLLEAQAAGLPCFASKNIVPEETNLTGNVCFIKLEDGAEKWANVILSKPMNRYDGIDKLLNSDYTVDKAAKKLMNIFDC